MSENSLTIEPFDDKWLGDGDSVHVLLTTLANPAQVTDEMVEAAVVAYNTTSPGGLANREQMRAALTAAIGAGDEQPFHLVEEFDDVGAQMVVAPAMGAGGQAVAWRKRLSDIDGHFTYSNVNMEGDWEPLYAHPAPSGQAVAWWHVGKWGNGTSCADESNIFCDAWETAIAENLPTEIAEAIVEAHNAALSAL